MRAMLVALLMASISLSGFINTGDSDSEEFEELVDDYIDNNNEVKEFLSRDGHRGIAKTIKFKIFVGLLYNYNI